MGPRKFRSSTYEVCITILEAKHLPQNANSTIVVKVGNRKRRTVIREKTDAPVFNEYFVFNLYCNLEELLSTKIMIIVYLKHYMRLKFHGSTSFEIALVWEQPDRQYYHKWAMLMNPKDHVGGSKGYVKCNIAINVKGEKMKINPELEGEDDIEGNLLLPLVAESLQFRQLARYIFTIYRADGLPDMSNLCVRSDLENINPFVQISFAGLKGYTREEWQTYRPKFNEKITFREMFPSLCQRVRIAIKHRVNPCHTCVVASYVLNLGQISHSGKYDFLPTFGPSFLHFYGFGSSERNSCFGKCSTSLPFYRGRLLFSLKTEMDDQVASSKIKSETESVPPIIERSLWKTEEYYLVAVLYDASMIDRRRFSWKLISFEVSLGNAGNRQFSHSQCFDDNNDGNGTMSNRWPSADNQTPSRKTGSLDGKYNYMPLGSRKPCLHVRSWWPNLEWRMHNSNNLTFIADFLEQKLNKLEGLMELEHPDVYMQYNEMIRIMKSYCIRYLNMLDMGKYVDKGGTTKLDRHRVNLCRSEIEDILRRIKISGELPDNNYMKIAMSHAYQYLSKLKKICKDPQHSLPDVFIWMIAGSKRVAYARFSPEEIIYSEKETERGNKCGKKVDVFLKNSWEEDEVDYTACKLEIFLWLGNAKYIGSCWSSIPPGYKVDHKRGVESFPKYLEYTQSTIFQLRAHIFQGRFDPGMDRSGLLDPLACIEFHGYTGTTRVIQQTLDPLWDQTLVLPPRTVHGTKQDIKLHPPKVIFQMFDQDICGINEFCGRCIAIPLVKLAEETYSPPDFPPKLEWYKFKSEKDFTGSVLAAFELIEVQDDSTANKPIDTSQPETIYNIPSDIRPVMTAYRLEIIFWGIRDLKKIDYFPVLKPRIVVECGGVYVTSEVMKNAKKFSNYEKPHVIVSLDMPLLDIYYPSITIKAYDSRGFGYFKFVGICIVPSIYVFLEQLITEAEYDAQIFEPTSIGKYHRLMKHPSRILPVSFDYHRSKDESNELISYKKMTNMNESSNFQIILHSLKKFLSYLLFYNRLMKKKKKREERVLRSERKNDVLDWWSKYYASLEEKNKQIGGRVRPGRKLTATFKVYDGELEMQPEFAGFQDCLRTFELWKGKKTGDPAYDRNNYVGKFKGRIAVYRWPHPDNLPCKTKTGRNMDNGLCNDYPPPEPVKLLVRLYVVKGINLQPNDPLSGKSDPYLCIKLGKTLINDQKNYIANQLNPTFGRMFEMKATFPEDYLLTIQVWDYDMVSSDDLIGETKIDLENRFYSKHRATCGISTRYRTADYNAWRDREKPSLILQKLCKKNNLSMPVYGKNYVKIGRKKFPFESLIEINKQERMALQVLHQWQHFPICGCMLVPEHIERRPLFNDSKYGLEQGKLELWIDMFQLDELPPKPPTDITAPLPKEYEIRVIIWNTEDVPLVESQFLTGEKCSDIYVKGWIVYDDCQKTDIHYNSLNGEGNFNWRFLFRVTYSICERQMTVRKKTSMLAKNETEEKIPCKLHLQVWDSDHFSPDDFLGALTLDLAKMPRGSTTSKNCKLNLLDPNMPTIDLFKVTRIKAWWPFARSIDTGSYIQSGKVELEISILTEEEAKEQPAGKGRNPPQNLPLPNRPDTSYSWIRNPLKAFRFVVCRFYKSRLLGGVLCMSVIAFVICGIFSVPGYTVKRLVGA